MESSQDSGIYEKINTGQEMHSDALDIHIEYMGWVGTRGDNNKLVVLGGEDKGYSQ